MPISMTPSLHGVLPLLPRLSFRGQWVWRWNERLTSMNGRRVMRNCQRPERNIPRNKITQILFTRSGAGQQGVCSPHGILYANSSSTGITAVPEEDGHTTCLPVLYIVFAGIG